MKEKEQLELILSNLSERSVDELMSKELESEVSKETLESLIKGGENE